MRGCQRDVLVKLVAGTVVFAALAPTACSEKPAQPSCIVTLSTGGQLQVAGITASSLMGGVQGAASCAWMATTSSEFLTIKAGASGTGNGTVQVDVAANNGGNRIGTVVVGGATLTINQNGAPCEF